MNLAILAPLLLTALSSPALADSLSDSMMRAGLDPDALAASGVVASEVAGIVSSVNDHLTSNPGDLSNADSGYIAAQADVSRLSRIVRSGSANAQEIADLAAAKQSLASADADRTSALDAVFSAGTAGLTASESGALSKIRANRDWGTPMEFLVKDRTDQAWLSLIEALTDERVSQAEGTSTSSACVALLLTERGDSAVSSAKADFDTNSTAVRASWTSAVSG